MPPAFEVLSLQEQGAVAFVDVRWPAPHGSLSERLLADLEALVTHLEDEGRASIVVFRDLSAGTTPAAAPKPEINQCRRWENLLVRIDRLAAVTIAVIDGTCERFCAQLAIACDHRVATARSEFYMPEVKEGYLPGMCTFRLTKFIGLARARRVIFTGARFKAAQATEWGLVDVCCDAGDAERALKGLIDELSPVDRTVIQLARRLLNESFATSFEDAIGNFLAAQHRCFGKGGEK